MQILGDRYDHIYGRGMRRPYDEAAKGHIAVRPCWGNRWSLFHYSYLCDYATFGRHPGGTGGASPAVHFWSGHGLTRRRAWSHIPGTGYHTVLFNIDYGGCFSLHVGIRARQSFAFIAAMVQS